MTWNYLFSYSRVKLICSSLAIQLELPLLFDQSPSLYWIPLWNQSQLFTVQGLRLANWKSSVSLKSQSQFYNVWTNQLGSDKPITVFHCLKLTNRKSVVSVISQSQSWSWKGIINLHHNLAFTFASVQVLQETIQANRILN